MTDQNVFYREASLPLCSHLDLETAISDCLEVLKKYMPADGITMQLLEPELKSSRTVFWGFTDSAKIAPLKNTIVSMPPEARRLIKKVPLPDLRIINRPELDPVANYFMEIAGGEFSNLAMFLYKEAKRFCVVILVKSSTYKSHAAFLSGSLGSQSISRIGVFTFRPVKPHFSNRSFIRIF